MIYTYNITQLKTITMNKFQRASIREREVLTTLFNKAKAQDYTFTNVDGYASYDAMLTGRTGTVYMVECKVRNVNSDTYLTTMIEKYKFDYLISTTKGTNIKPNLTVVFKDNLMFNTTLSEDMEYEIGWAWCPKTTMGDDEYVYKEVVYITIEKNKLFNCNFLK